MPLLVIRRPMFCRMGTHRCCLLPAPKQRPFYFKSQESTLKCTFQGLRDGFTVRLMPTTEASLYGMVWCIWLRCSTRDTAPQSHSQTCVNSEPVSPYSRIVSSHVSLYTRVHLFHRLCKCISLGQFVRGNH